MISFKDVTIQFFNNTFGVRNVTLEIEPGEFILITGPTGSGKTTLMRLLTKEYEPTAGEIYFEDEPLAKIRKSKLHLHRRRIGVVFQDYRLLPEYNVWENIALPLAIVGKSDAKIEERVTDLLKLVHLEEKADLFPNELSGGEEQRVSIARALATAPQVLLADEPTGNLDPVTSKNILKLLQKINELGTTVLVSTHDVVLIELAKNLRQLHLDDGEVKSDSKSKKKAADTVKEEVEKDHKHDAEEQTEEMAELKKEPKKKVRSIFPFGKKAKSKPEEEAAS